MISTLQKYFILKKDKYIFLFTDFWSIIFSIIVCKWTFSQLNNPISNKTVLAFSAILLISWAMVTKLYVSKQRTGNRRKATKWESVKEFLEKWIKSFLVVGLTLYIFDFSFSKFYFISSFSAFLFLGLLNRTAAKQLLEDIRRKGFNYRKISIISGKEAIDDLAEEASKHPEYGFKIKHKYEVEEENGSYTYDFGEICKDLANFGIDYVYVNIDLFTKVELNYFLRFCELNSIKVHFIQKGLQSLYDETYRLEIDYFGETPTLSLAERSGEQVLSLLMKRAVDIILSSFFLICIASWLFPLIGLIIKLNSRGPVFFKQKRTGLNGKVFSCLKFRTMRVNEDADHKQAEKGDDRITSIGHVLRKTSLDELPQFINVLSGSMSIVGPRPHMCKHTEEYSELIRPFTFRHWVKPGITGLAQIKGYRGETKNIRRMEHRVRMDLFYVKNWSVWLDAKIFFQTAWAFLTFKNLGE
ncbi:MAG: exopolysaccharide biosynthesis polyprenyl glycosylphosphotransferase [Flavobacteriales bacterium]|nr:exopolysaccharide biosynthesis polyprenyl glycosylphosphotransferase [Flavobacteriales bacterium]